MRSSNPAAPIAPLTPSDGFVVARPWQPGDAPALYDAARESIATVGPWLPWLDDLYTRENAERWVADNQRVAAGIGATFEGELR